MTNEEAYRHIISKYDLTRYDEKDNIAVGIAINALEKQKAKKPKGKYTCPKCGGRICIQYYSEENEWTEKYVTFCPDCGQKIDWSDNE